MRFNKNKFEFLDNFIKGKQLDIHPRFKDKFNSENFAVEKDFLFNGMFPICSKSIYYLAKSIRNKIADPVLMTKLLKLRNEIQTQCGTLLFTEEVKGRTIHFGSFYSFFNCSKDDGKDDIVFFKLSTFQGNTLVDNISGHWKKETPGLLYFNSGTYLGFYDISNPENIPAGIRITVDSLTALILFIKFAEIETKVLTGTGTYKKCILNNEKYLNELNTPINIIDSTWFTTLIKSDEFSVEGHFRLQPVGKGKQDRKLIWINDFIKHGYTRKAKMLNV